MSDVKRYNCRIPADSLLGANLYQQVVLASDYDALYRKERHYLNRCAALEVERGELREFADTLEAERDALRTEVERLRKDAEKPDTVKVSRDLLQAALLEVDILLDKLNDAWSYAGYTGPDEKLGPNLRMLARKLAGGAE